MSNSRGPLPSLLALAVGRHCTPGDVTGEVPAAPPPSETPSLPAVEWRPPALDRLTVAESLGDHPDPRALEHVQHQVAAAVAQLRFAMRAGPLPPGVQLVLDRPLADWLPAEALAGLLRELGP